MEFKSYEPRPTANQEEGGVRRFSGSLLVANMHLCWTWLQEIIADRRNLRESSHL